MRILIVDDHAAVRTGVRGTIENYKDDMEVVGEGATGEEAIEQTAKLHPDLIIMDVSMPVLDGLSAAEIIKRHYPQTRILMFSMHTIREFVEAAKRLGLSGYVPKDGNGLSLLDAVEAVQHNKTCFPI
jgi:DNA-binding NarL/FixJ family response regulator